MNEQILNQSLIFIIVINDRNFEFEADLDLAWKV